MVKESENADIAKKAYIALNTIRILIEKIPNNPPIKVGEQIAKQVNSLLEQVKSVFSIDKVFVESISHLDKLKYEYEAGGASEGAMWTESDNGEQIASQAKVLLAELEAKLISFVSFYMPTKEKEKIGFHP